MDEDDKDPDHVSRYVRSFSLGNVLTIITVIGAMVAVYSDIRVNQGVEQDRIAQLTRDLAAYQKSQQDFADKMQAQVIQLLKDVSYLSGLEGSGKIQKPARTTR